MFQEVWNPVIIGLFLWFAGIAGMGSVAYALMKLGKVEEKTKELSCVVFASIVLALVFVVADLSRPLNMPLAIIRSVLSGTFFYKLSTSWMTIGISLLSILLLLALLVLLRETVAKGLQKIVDAKWYLVLTGFVGFMVVIYSGFLIADAPGVPFWNNSLIPVLWILSASICAIAVLKILVHKPEVSNFLTKSGLAVDIAEAVALASLLNVSLYSGVEAARRSAEALVAGELAAAFWLLVVLVGVAVPMVLGFMLLRKEDRRLALLAAACALVGALALRILVLQAGIFLELSL